MNSFNYNGVASPERPCGIRGSVLDTPPPREQRKERTSRRKLRVPSARGEGSTAARSALARTPTRVGRIHPRPGHFGDIPWHSPGGPRCDSQVPTRARPGWSRDPGSPSGERGSSPSKFVADWTGSVVACGNPPMDCRCGDLGCLSGEARGLVVFGANSRISLGNGSSERVLPAAGQPGVGLLPPCSVHARGDG